MKRKEAFLRNGEVAHKFSTSSLYNRSESSRWYADYSPEQMAYLWDHRYIEWDEPITFLGESPNKKYIKFTNKGLNWREWYTISHWDYIKYYFLGYTFWKYKVYYPIRKYVFGKSYPWEGYENYT